METKTPNDKIELARQSGYNEASYVWEKRFKQAIQKLKEIPMIKQMGIGGEVIMEEIDKIFGDDLTK